MFLFSINFKQIVRNANFKMEYSVKTEGIKRQNRKGLLLSRLILVDISKCSITDFTSNA